MNMFQWLNATKSQNSWLKEVSMSKLQILNDVVMNLNNRSDICNLHVLDMDNIAP